MVMGPSVVSGPQNPPHPGAITPPSVSTSQAPSLRMPAFLVEYTLLLLGIQLLEDSQPAQKLNFVCKSGRNVLATLGPLLPTLDNGILPGPQRNHWASSGDAAELMEVEGVMTPVFCRNRAPLSFAKRILEWGGSGLHAGVHDLTQTLVEGGAPLILTGYEFPFGINNTALVVCKATSKSDIMRIQKCLGGADSVHDAHVVLFFQGRESALPHPPPFRVASFSTDAHTGSLPLHSVMRGLKNLSARFTGTESVQDLTQALTDLKNDGSADNPVQGFKVIPESLDLEGDVMVVTSTPLVGVLEELSLDSGFGFSSFLSPDSFPGLETACYLLRSRLADCKTLKSLSIPHVIAGTALINNQEAVLPGQPEPQDVAVADGVEDEAASEGGSVHSTVGSIHHQQAMESAWEIFDEQDLLTIPGSPEDTRGWLPPNLKELTLWGGSFTAGVGRNVEVDPRDITARALLPGSLPGVATAVVLPRLFPKSLQHLTLRAVHRKATATFLSDIGSKVPNLRSLTLASCFEMGSKVNSDEVVHMTYEISNAPRLVMLSLEHEYPAHRVERFVSEDELLHSAPASESGAPVKSRLPSGSAVLTTLSQPIATAQATFSAAVSMYEKSLLAFWESHAFASSEVTPPPSRPGGPMSPMESPEHHLPFFSEDSHLMDPHHVHGDGTSLYDEFLPLPAYHFPKVVPTSGGTIRSSTGETDTAIAWPILLLGQGVSPHRIRLSVRNPPTIQRHRPNTPSEDVEGGDAFDAMLAPKSHQRRHRSFLQQVAVGVSRAVFGRRSRNSRRSRSGQKQRSGTESAPDGGVLKLPVPLARIEFADPSDSLELTSVDAMGSTLIVAGVESSPEVYGSVVTTVF